MTRRLMIAGVAVLVAAQSALVLDAAADQISIEQRSRLNAEIAGMPAELRTRFDELYRNRRTTWVAQRLAAAGLTLWTARYVMLRDSRTR